MKTYCSRHTQWLSSPQVRLSSAGRLSYNPQSPPFNLFLCLRHLLTLHESRDPFPSLYLLRLRSQGPQGQTWEDIPGTRPLPDPLPASEGVSSHTGRALLAYYGGKLPQGITTAFLFRLKSRHRPGLVLGVAPPGA